MPYNLGDIRLFAGTFPPKDWAFCDGSLLNTRAHGGLFQLIGTTYGGDGQNDFALPDFRGRLPVGAGAGPGLNPRILGDQMGEAEHVLTVSEMPTHRHGVNASSANATHIDPGTSVVIATAALDVLHFTDTTKPTDVPHNFSAQSIAPFGAMHPAHDNVMPSLGMNFIICLVGNWPQ